MKLPTITSKQQTILTLLYRYRFLERKQIQLFLGHTNKSRVIRWLKELREQQFIDWIYDPDSPEDKSKPAIYFLALNGIRLLREFGDYPEEEMRKRYKDSTRTRAFIERCLLIADCCLNMEARTAEGSNVTYSYNTEADYLNPNNDYYFLSESEFIRPHLCYLKEKDTDDDFIAVNYVVEIFDVTTPRYMVKKKLKDYVNFLGSDEWEGGTGDGELPIVHIACPSVAELIYAKRYMRKLLEDAGQEDNEDICIRFATVEQIKKFGVTGKIWEDV
jgi:Replication-relaxation